MKIQANEILLTILGVIGTLILTILFGDKLTAPEKFSSSDYLILLGFVIIFIVIFFNRKIAEVDEDVKKLEKEQIRLGEKLKIHEQLINLEARIIALEKGGKYDKN